MLLPRFFSSSLEPRVAHSHSRFSATLTAAAIKGPQIDYGKFNAMLNIITSSKPRNEFDTMLALHAALTRNAIIKVGSQMSAAETFGHQELMQRMYSKLARTFLDQHEALNRGRARDENTLAVQQTVNVSGGQAAIVNHVTHNEAPIEAASSPVLVPSATPIPLIDNDARRTTAPLERVRLPDLSSATESVKPTAVHSQRKRAG